MTDSKSNSKSANIKNNSKQTAANKTNSMHEFLSNKNSSRFVTNKQPVKLVSPGEKLRQPMKREATPMKQYLTTREEKIFANNREKKLPLGGISNLKTKTKLREENTPKPTENATIKVQSNNVNLVTESKEMNKTSAKNSKDKPKAPKKSPFMKSDRKMNVYSSLVYKNKMKQEAKARREAEELAKLPKEPVKRFFAKLAPKRVMHNLFSKKGLFMLLKFGAAMFLIAIIAIGGLFLYFKKDLDEIRLDQMKVTGTVNTYLDRNGQTLWEDKGDGDYRLVVDGDNISTYMRQATVAIEDRDFYNHPGVNFSALIRAALSTVTGRGVQGGSTLTQQLIKQVYFADEAGNRTVSGLPRKIKEMILALEVEKMYSKEQIITMYLNESPYGGRRNGVESAAQAYFKKSAKDLTLGESALLASIPNNPTLLSPYNTAYNKSLIERQHKTLDVMVKMGYITEDQAKAAKEEKVLESIQPESSRYTDIKAPHFVLEVKHQLEEKYGVKTMRAGGFTIKTSLDLKAQEYAEKAVANGSALMYQNGSDNISLSSVDVETGQVIAMVGSADWSKPVYGEVNASTSLLEPGSSIKPILDYAPLFKQREGANYGAGSILKDENIDNFYCAGFTGNCKLRNYTGAFYGNISIRKALANSLNIPAVKALYINGIEDSIKTAHDLGDMSYCTDTSGGLSIAIGSGCTVKPIEHANAYASLARGGVYKPLSYILEVKNGSGDVLEKWEDTSGNRVLDSQAAYMVSDILSDTSARSMVFGSLGASFGFVVPGVWTATKTGTTTTNVSTVTKDSLIASYSPVVATVVWNGNHDGRGLTNSSNTIVRRVVNDYMEPVHKDVYANAGKWKSGDKVQKPAGIQTLTVSGITDIFPSWFNNKTSGAQTEKMKFNRINKHKASDCTDPSLIEEVDISFTIDPISKNKSFAKSADGYDPFTTDDCSYRAPTVRIKNSTINSGSVLKFEAKAGSEQLDSYTVSVDGTVVASGTAQAGDNTTTYTMTGSETSIVVTLKDRAGSTVTNKLGS